ncbi:hypothetical protein HGM15179_010696, partial [Zosterops borbonicus]
MKGNGDAGIHLQPMEETWARTDGCLRKDCELWEVSVGAGSWQGPSDLWREKPTLHQFS